MNVNETKDQAVNLTNRSAADPAGSPKRQSATSSQQEADADDSAQASTGQGSFRSDSGDQRDSWRRLTAEFVGTFWLTFVAAGGDVIGAASGGDIGRAARVIAPALLVMAMIYTVGNISGAHFNPAVTLAFATRGDFPWVNVPGYWIAQLCGATAAAGVLRALYGNVGHLGATLPSRGDIPAVVMEILLTFLLVTVIFGTAKSHKIVGHNAALAVAATISLTGLFASPISGASMNPARSLGPDIVAGTMGTAWIYVVGPLVGALCAVGITWILAGAPSRYERHAALGS